MTAPCSMCLADAIQPSFYSPSTQRGTIHTAVTTVLEILTTIAEGDIFVFLAKQGDIHTGTTHDFLFEVLGMTSRPSSSSTQTLILPAVQIRQYSNRRLRELARSSSLRLSQGHACSFPLYHLLSTPGLSSMYMIRRQQCRRQSLFPARERARIAELVEVLRYIVCTPNSTSIKTWRRKLRPRSKVLRI